MSPIPLSRPDISSLERAYVEQVLGSTQLASGPRRDAFEHQMAARCQTQYAIAVNSGTAALHLIACALGLGPDDEVVTTPFSFVASANSLLYVGATPRFADIDPDTLNLDVDAVAAAINERTRAILAVDVFGMPADWPALTALANKHNLLLIDDACEAPGASIAGRPIGAWGQAAAFGFYPNKPLTTGEGGCITTNDEEINRLCRSLRNQGRTRDDRMEHALLGYNYRMDELSAALGCAQLERLDDILARRAQAARRYHERLQHLHSHVILPSDCSGSYKRSWFVYVIQLSPNVSADTRDLVIDALRNEHIGCAPYFPCIHLQPLYRERFGLEAGSFPVAESVASRTIALPFFSTISENEQDRVAETLQRVLLNLPRHARAFTFE